MDIINIPDKKEHINNQDFIDGPLPIVQAHALCYGRLKFVDPNSFFLQNTKRITFLPKKWNTVLFDVTIVTNLPAMCVCICNVRTLYIHNLSQGSLISNTNDNYLKIDLYNNASHTVTLNPSELLVRCFIVLKKQMQPPSMHLL
jgi:hypothetical protein